MNVLLLFFALPLAIIIISIALQKILKNPILVAGIIFSIFLIITFLINNINFLIATIIYTLISYLSAKLFCVINKIRRELEIRMGNNSCCRKEDNNYCCNTNELLTINSRCGNSENGNLLTISSNCSNGMNNDLLTINSNIENSNNNNCCNNSCSNNIGNNGVTARVNVIPNSNNNGRTGNICGRYRRNCQ